jgi:lipopolysaccharide transport system ATP-binding protein
MSAPAVSVEGLGKRYELGTVGSATSLLSERLGQALKGRRAGRLDDGVPPEEFWALRDVSLEIAPGDALGLIGHNGAGKSTLLKLLARITPPSEGRITLRGRVASLLEVGTGFHPELTGRENIYLNGAILGMRRREILAKFDRIVEFSGIERFIDTPVKRYSSGMYVRLAFAVAAHLEPEILLVDEVLAVGDAEFQRRCLGRMEEITEGGRTVIFVSHNLAAVRRICPRAVVIESGRLAMEGPSAEVVSYYLKQSASSQTGGVAEIPPGAARQGDGRARLRLVRLQDADGRPRDTLPMSRTLDVHLRFDCERPVPDACVVVGISTPDGQRVATAQSLGADRPAQPLGVGPFDATVSMAVTLVPGQYAIDVALTNLSGYIVDQVDRALRFTVLNAADEGIDEYPWPTLSGHVRAESEWSLARADEILGASSRGQA